MYYSTIHINTDKSVSYSIQVNRLQDILLPGCLKLQVCLACLCLKGNLNDAFLTEISTCMSRRKGKFCRKINDVNRKLLQ